MDISSITVDRKTFLSLLDCFGTLVKMLSDCVKCGTLGSLSESIALICLLILNASTTLSWFMLGES